MQHRANTLGKIKPMHCLHPYKHYSVSLLGWAIYFVACFALGALFMFFLKN